LTLAYTFTHIKSQGQTLECVIDDIGKPPSGSLTGFDAYVALSRSRGRDTIRLLKNFKNFDEIFLPSVQTNNFDRETECLLRWNQQRCYYVTNLENLATSLPLRDDFKW
ncbi:hypothetical protein EDB86DRAFT_2808658, partial [Lactarius hatsudake]